MYSLALMRSVGAVLVEEASIHRKPLRSSEAMAFLLLYLHLDGFMKTIRPLSFSLGTRSFGVYYCPICTCMDLGRFLFAPAFVPALEKWNIVKERYKRSGTFIQITVEYLHCHRLSRKNLGTICVGSSYNHFLVQ